MESGVKPEDFSPGKKFGRWTVLSFTKRTKHYSYWLCRCDCGVERQVIRNMITGGRSKSCGCLSKELVSARSRRHGLSYSKEYKIWVAMLGRCSNRSNKRYADYGGRGIKVCDRWLKFDAFYADLGPRPNGGTLDRIDNDLGYFPENCRWATTKQQSRNKRNSRLITCHGETRCVSEWSEITGLSRNVIFGRLARGWTHEQTIQIRNLSRGGKHLHMVTKNDFRDSSV